MHNGGNQRQLVKMEPLLLLFSQQAGEAQVFQMK